MLFRSSPANYSNVAANTAKTVTVTAVATGNSTITVTFTPTSSNYSAVTKTYTAQVDKTAPSVPTSVIRYDSSSGEVRGNSSAWTNRTLWWGNFSSTDSNSGINHYEFSNGCTGSKSDNLVESYTYSSNIDALMKGAADAREQYMSPELDKNDCYRYAAIRNILYRSGKKIEMMAAYEIGRASCRERV